MADIQEIIRRLLRNILRRSSFFSSILILVFSFLTLLRIGIGFLESASSNFAQGEFSIGRRKGVSIDRHGNAFFRFKMALHRLIHAFGKLAGDPNLAALVANPDKNILKEIQMSCGQAIQRDFTQVQFSSALSAQRVFHDIRSLLVLGSSHLAGSNQWTVMI